MAYWSYCRQNFTWCRDDYKSKAILEQIWLNVSILFLSFIYLYLTYCNHIWGATYKTRLARLVMLQKKAVRILSHAGNRTSSDPLYRKLDIMKVQNIHTYLTGRFMFCVSIDKVPQSFRTLFRKKQWISLLQCQICPSFTYTFSEIRLK